MNEENSKSIVLFEPTQSPNQSISSETTTDAINPNVPPKQSQVMNAVACCRCCCGLLYCLLAVLSIPIVIILLAISAASTTCSTQRSSYGCDKGCFLDISSDYKPCKSCEWLDEYTCRDFGKGSCEWSNKYASCKAPSCSSLAKLFDSGNFSFALAYGNDSYSTGWAREYCHKAHKCLLTKSQNRCSQWSLSMLTLAIVVPSIVVVVIALSVLILVCYKKLVAKERAKSTHVMYDGERAESTHVVYNGEIDEMDIEAAAMTNRLREQNIHEVITGRDLRENFKLDEGEKI